MTGAADDVGPVDAAALHDYGGRVMSQSGAAISRAGDLLDDEFEKAVRLLLDLEGSVLVSGIGKSGLVGRKISATLASTGTPSHWLHPTEAMHGDLGRFRRDDVALLLSYGGGTEEVVGLASILRRERIPVISITNDPGSPLGQLSDAALSTGRVEEVDPDQLAPAASSAVMLALGDALAITVSHFGPFDRAEFHRRHPGGSLGRAMMPVEDVMRFRVGTNTAVVEPDASVRDMLEAAAEYPRRCGAVLVVDSTGRLAGILTDADIRRLLVTEGASTLDRLVRDVMTADPTSVGAGDRLTDVVRVVRELRIDEVPVVDRDGCPTGVIDVQDLIAMRITVE